MIDRRLILFQAYRRCSLNFYGRRLTEDGILTIDNDLTEETASETRQLMEGSPFNIEEDFNRDYGIFIVSPKDTNKRLGTQLLLQELSLTQIGMLGDSISDIVGNDLAIHYGVSNAKPALVQVADYISRQEFTSGVVSILQNIKD